MLPLNPVSPDESATLPEAFAQRGIVTYLEIIRAANQNRFSLADLEMLANVAKYQVRVTLLQADEILTELQSQETAAEAIAAGAMAGEPVC